MSFLKDIQGSDGDALAGRKVALAVSGSIAAIESPRLARLLMRQGADVFVVMSRQATRLVHPTALEWSTGNPVVTRLSAQVEHLELARCDVVLLAPATANTISKMALGIDDTPVTTLMSTALGTGRPIVVAPAMHEPMLGNPAVQRNLETLTGMGVRMVAPQVAEDKAKMAPPEDIVEAVVEAVTRPTLQGCRVLITAGPTIEYLDPIRTIGNQSSGQMGMALAREARRRGAQVTVVYGPGQAEPPPGVKVVRVRTTADMLAAVQQAVVSSDIAVFAAAVADYTVRNPSKNKLATAEGAVTIELVPTPKIIDQVRPLAPRACFVGFKAETGTTDELVQVARARLTSSRLQLVIANHADNFGSTSGELYVVDAETTKHLGPAPKPVLARDVWDEILPRWHKA
ncbi:MAG TPA: bifunctional phosphopantothenoylcysteine decarboxylase/phosphopantothenate--cysteine ligase CoaBC [Candidatus Xenobia bacterium]